MYLIVGLGNPGKEYEATRHNMGFQVIDKLIKKWNISLNKEDFHGLYTKTKFNDEDVIILKPMTYMNLSGQSVSEICSFFKIKIEDVLVIYDDIDTVPGNIRLREKGSAGGQNGIKNIIQLMGTDQIKRIKIGTGKPTFDIISYVLGVPSDEDKEKIEKAQDNAVKAIEAYLTKGFMYAQSRYH